MHVRRWYDNIEKVGYLGTGHWQGYIRDSQLVPTTSLLVCPKGETPTLSEVCINKRSAEGLQIREQRTVCNFIRLSVTEHDFP